MKSAIDAWTTEGGITEGCVFRPVNRGDRVCGLRLSEKVVWQTLKGYVARGLQILLRLTCGGRRRNCVERPEENLSRFSYSGGTLRCRLRNGILAPSRICYMHLMTQSR